MNKYNLKDLDAAEVSLVLKGANRKKFLIFKSEEVKESMEEILKSILETGLEDENKVNEVLKAAKLSDKAQGAVKGALKLLTAYKDELPKDILKTLAELVGYGYPEPTEKQKNKNEEDKKYGYPAPAKKADGSYDFSNIPEEVRPAVETLWKEHEAAVKKAEELEKVLKEEKDKQLKKEFIQKAAAEFMHLPTKPEEFGLILKGISEKAPEEYGKLESILKAANEAIEKGALYSEIGRSGAPVGDSAVAKVEALVSGIVQKDAKISRVDALMKVLSENPQLYAEYCRETAIKV